MREAVPGSMRIPAGAKDRERFEILEAKVQALVARVEALETELLKRGPGRPSKA
jgi:hypothetical protein